MIVPVVDLSECVLCEICTDVCPEVFRMNDAGFVEIIELPEYPKDDVNEIIKSCPGDCISWEDN
ncbi:MAG: ferredoxin [Desulfobacterales bacterium]|nr:ferredoxin [Desulfobacterales bacterium]